MTVFMTVFVLARKSPFASIILLAALSTACTAHAQQAAPRASVPDATATSLSGAAVPGSPLSGSPSAFGSNTSDPAQVRMVRDMLKQRNMLRQKEIVTDTNHLLDLAKQLKEDVDKSSKDQLSVSVVSTANEIEKLAKSVKEKMRDGQ